MSQAPAITEDWGAWAMSRVGIAIDAVVDRELREQYAPNPGHAYGIGPTGQIYRQGQPAPTAQATAAGWLTPTNLMLAAGAVLVAVLLLRK